VSQTVRDEGRMMVYWLNSLHLPACLVVRGMAELRDGIALAELARCLADVRENYGGDRGVPVGFQPTAAQVPLKAVPEAVPRVGYAAVAGRLVAALRPLQGVGGVPPAERLPDLCVAVAKGDSHATVHVLRCLRRIHQAMDKPLHPDVLWAGYLTPSKQVKRARGEEGGEAAAGGEGGEAAAGGEEGVGGEEGNISRELNFDDEEAARERLAWREEEREKRAQGQDGIPVSAEEEEISKALAYVRAAREARPSSAEASAKEPHAGDGAEVGGRDAEAAERAWEARLHAYLRRKGKVLACKRVRDPLDGFARHGPVNLAERGQDLPRRPAWHVDPGAPEREALQRMFVAHGMSARVLEGLVHPEDLEAQGVRVISTPLRKRIPPPGARELVVTSDLTKVLDRLYHAMHGRNSFKRFVDVFGGVDEDHDGKLTRWELRMAVAQRLGVVLKNAQLEPLAKAIEDGPDGFLSLAGLYRIAASYKPHWT